MHVLASKARLLGNREVHEEFEEDDHYVGLVSNCPPLSFCVALNCHGSYMLSLRHEDETYAKLVMVARALSRPNFVTSSPIFYRFKWSIINQQHGMKM